MRRVKVKICGITNWLDARRACEAGADFLGFNFCPRSPRYISPARARSIVRRLPKGVAAVGVFVNETEQSMTDTARRVGLEYLQLHGDESPELISNLRRSFKVVKAVRVRKSFRIDEIGKFGAASAILLDGFDSRLRGGTGKTFDWTRARGGKLGLRQRIFLAGGITTENARDAISIAKPYAIDVCSGVEATPGKKDPAKMKALMLAVNGSHRTQKKR
jgi:phosphoribosylanthranilate isomerase